MIETKVARWRERGREGFTRQEMEREKKERSSEKEINRERKKERKKEREREKKCKITFVFSLIFFSGCWKPAYAKK